MTKKSFLTIAMVFLGLLAGTNTMWAADPTEQPVFLVTLRAQSSATESTGSGEVQLTWIDMRGELFNNKLTNSLNANNPSVQGASAAVTGLSLFATESVETDKISMGEHLYMTPFCYFKADAVGDPGSYFSHWAFSDSKIMRQDTAMDKKAPNSAYFKVLPNTTNQGAITIETAEGTGAQTMTPNWAAAYASSTANPNNIYAVFKKYLLSNPQATNGHMNAGVGNSATLTVSVDVEGDISQLKNDPSYPDFVLPSAAPSTVFFEDEYGAWSWTIDNTEVLSANKMRVHLQITYKARTADTGKRNATLTIRMAHADPSKASTLNIPLSVDVRPATTTTAEATLYDGKTPTDTKGALTDMIAAANGTDKIVVLNQDYASALNINAAVTIDLNGYNINNALTVSGGDVTIAYSKYGGTATSLMVNGGKAVLKGGTFGSLTIGTNGEVEQNGAKIMGTVSNAGTLTTTEGEVRDGLTSTNGTLTLNGGVFKGEAAVTVSGGTANINKGTLNGTTCGLLVSGGTVKTGKLAIVNSEGTYSAKQENTGKLNVESGKFNKPLNGTINFTSGYFTTNTYGVSTEGKTEFLISVGVEYNEGYRYFLGTAESALVNGVGVCRIGATSYARLEDALAYANNKPSEEVVIFMTNDYTLPAGYYTLPAKATLVVPMSDEQAKEVNTEAPRISFNDVDATHPYVQPTEYRRLTFAAGVNMEVFGDIELTCTQFASNEAYTSQPYGPYGRLVMEAGSSMTLQSGSELRAWGFVTGAGEIDARRGSKVREMFQMGDWKGALTSVLITGMGAPLGMNDFSDRKIFPVTQYFIQNVESPVKYHPGAVLSTSAAVSEGVFGMGISMAATDIKIVGISGTDEAIFLMGLAADAENTWVRKWYDAENDIQVYDINSGAHIGSMVLDMGELSLMGISVPVRLNSAKFDLPITSNMKIHLLTGAMDFEQNTSLVPGAEVEVDKESVVTISMTAEDKAKLSRWRAAIEAGTDPDPADTVLYSGAVHVYDADQWDKYAFCRVNGEADGTAYTKIVRYAPSWEERGTTPGKPDVHSEQKKPADATINVHGTFNTAEGYVYTSSSGANIYSSNTDAGTFIFNEDASLAGTRTVYQIKGEGSSSSNYEHTVFSSAKLKNADGYAETTTAEAGDAYCYIDGRWTIMKVDEDDNCFMVDNYGTFYAKPSEYVAIVATKDPSIKEISGNDDHTFSDADGAGRLFIRVGDDCQWWEVEKKDNLYHCIHPNNDTYYYWDEDEGGWVEKRFTITWKNWDGTIVQTKDADGHSIDYDVVKYGTMAEFLGTNPTRKASADYTYDFVGWTPELGPVKSDVTYTATYKPKQRKYTIIFQNEGGSEIERQFLPREAVPVCENMPTKVGHILQWKPSIAAVTGDQTYTATWLEELPDTWDITFSNYDGTPLLELTKEKDAAVTAGTSPKYTGATPTKVDPLSEYNFTFAGWKGLDGTVYAPGDALPAATENATYVAQFTPEIKKYTISYFKEDGTTPNSTKASEELPYGATPMPPAVSPENQEEGYTYTLVWKTTTGDPAIPIQIVTGPASYKPTYEAVKNKYTVTLTSDIAGACTFSGAGIYDHGTEITIKAIPAEGYEFVKWNETGETNANLGSRAITEDITLTAIVKVAEPVVEDLEIAADGDVTLGSPKTYPNLVITSNGVTSGQLHDPENLTIEGDAYFNLEMEMAALTWYAVAVPWKVDATNGIIVNGSPLRLVTDIDVLYYDGASRADNGTGAGISNWKYVADLDDKTLNPGTLYMIYLANPTSSIRFKKKAGADISTTELSVQKHTSQTGSDIDAGWNGIANPALYHAFINAGASTVIPGEGATQHPHYAQKYVPGADSYVSFVMETNPLIVGAPIFVQVATSNTISAYETKSGAGYASAPRRAPRVDNASYEVQISDGKEYTDRIFLQTMEDKEDRYIIELDLAKAGVSNKVAQMWVNRYNAKLCVNTTAPVGKTATYPLGISIPENGTYQISSATEMQNNQELYVTRNGKAIWNLAYGPYTVTLDKGTYSEYGIKLIQSNAPAVTTGVDQTTNDKQQIQKVVIDNHVYIVREGQLYTITGQKVK